MAGISVERKSCRKINTTMNTRINASIKVLITSWIEAKRKSFTLCATLMSMPSGKSFLHSSRRAVTSLTICVALEPAICITIHDTALWPFTLPVNEYVVRPSSTRATSFTRTSVPSGLERITMFSKSLTSLRRPL